LLFRWLAGLKNLNLPTSETCQKISIF